MSFLVWSSHAHMTGVETAVGLRGEYVLQRFAGAYVLTATGHDTLPLLDLDPSGRQFTRVDDAKYFANRLDRVRAREPEISGA